MRVMIDDALREMRTLNDELRQEMRALHEETRAQMRTQHEDVVSRLALLAEPSPSSAPAAAPDFQAPILNRTSRR